MRRAFLLLCTAAILLGPAEAAPLWTNIGPFGGEARSLSSDASGRNVYLLNRRSGISRSFNGGPWTLVFDAMARGVTPTRVVVDPQSSRVYVGTTTGLFRSDDNGTTWRQLLGVSIIDASAQGSEIIISTPRDGLLRSVDGGDTWGGISSPTSSNVSIIRMDPRATDHLVAIVSGNYYFSNDAGNSWHLLPPTNIVSVAFGDLIYAGGRDGVWGCSDDCTQITTSGIDAVASWRSTLYATLGEAVVSLSVGRLEVVGVISPAASVLSLEGTPSTLLAGTPAGVFATNDGLRWLSRNEGLTNVRITEMAIVAGTLVTATADQGVLRRDGGGWTGADAGLLHPNVPFLVTNGSTLYAALPGEGVFRSTNQGVSWENVSSGLPSTDIFDLAADGDKVVVTTFRNVIQSLDRGATWQTIANYPSLSATVLAVKGRTMAVADVASAVISADDGATWQRSDVPTTIRQFAIADDRIFAGTDLGLFLRKNGVWTLALAGRVNAITASGSRLYASVTSGVYFSDDGSSWVFVPGSETLPADVTSVASDGTSVYAGTNGGSIFAASLQQQQQRRRAVRR